MHTVDGILHLFVVALAGNLDLFAQVAAADQGEDRLPSPMGSRMASSISLTPLTMSGVCPLELLRLAAFRESAFPGCLGQPH